MTELLRRSFAVVFAVTLALTAVMLPVAADEDDDDEMSAQTGPLEVEGRPGVVPTGATFIVHAEYETEAEDTDADEPGEEPTEPGPPETSTAPVDEEEITGRPSSTEFSVDYGDGTPRESMTVTSERTEDGEYEAEALGRHRYLLEGNYTVTVTATPSNGEPVSASIQVAVGQGSARMAGEDRFSTSTRLSREAFPEDGTAESVLLARADAFADALAAGALTLLEDAPVLLTTTADVPQQVLDEIVRGLGETGTVYLLGGEAAISSSVADALTQMGYEVVRIAGTDRVDTAVQIAQFLVDSGADIDQVLLASAGNFPDALAGGSFAAVDEAPILLTPSTSLDPRVEALLRDLGAEVRVLVLGGQAAVSEEVVRQVEALGNEVQRLSGGDRFATSAVVAESLFSDATAVVVATGATFPDALSGSALAARQTAPVLLVAGELPDSVRAYLQARAEQIQVVYFLGGTNAVSAEVRAEVEQVVGVNRSP